MRLLLSIPMALLGSLFGAALRSGLKVAEARLDATPDAPAPEMDITVNGSVLAAAGGGLMGLLFGTRTAFWSGLALGAAGMERFDARLLRMGGIDLDGLIQRARSMAEQAGDQVAAARGDGGEPMDATESERSVESVEIPIESTSSEPA